MQYILLDGMSKFHVRIVCQGGDHKRKCDPKDTTTR